MGEDWGGVHHLAGCPAPVLAAASYTSCGRGRGLQKEEDAPSILSDSTEVLTWVRGWGAGLTEPEAGVLGGLRRGGENQTLQPRVNPGPPDDKLGSLGPP